MTTGLASILASALAVGCASWLPAPVPMKAVDHRSQRPPARCLVVFLPGMGDSAEDFEARGFVEEFNRRRLSIDMVAANATLGYYAKGILSERLFTDVVRPRLTRNYAEVWLVGMSMGGLGTLMYSRQRPPGEVTGVLALAPYLGDSDLIDEIHAAGGLARWKAPAKVERLTESNYQSEIWRWLKAVTEQREPGPTIHLAYGHDDHLARADSLLGAALPKDQVFTGPGEHKWVTWRTLLARFLDTSEFRTHCAADRVEPPTPQGT